MVVSRNLFLLRGGGGLKLLLFLTRGPETLSLVSWKLSINRNLGVKSWMWFLNSMVLVFDIGVNPLLNKFIRLSVNALDEKLIIIFFLGAGGGGGDLYSLQSV